MNIKQRKIQIEQKTKLNYNSYNTWLQAAELSLTLFKQGCTVHVTTVYNVSLYFP